MWHPFAGMLQLPLGCAWLRDLPSHEFPRYPVECCGMRRERGVSNLRCVRSHKSWVAGHLQTHPYPDPLWHAACLWCSLLRGCLLISVAAISYMSDLVCITWVMVSWAKPSAGTGRGECCRASRCHVLWAFREVSMCWYSYTLTHMCLNMRSICVYTCRVLMLVFGVEYVTRLVVWIWTYVVISLQCFVHM